MKTQRALKNSERYTQAIFKQGLELAMDLRKTVLESTADYQSMSTPEFNALFQYMVEEASICLAFSLTCATEVKLDRDFLTGETYITLTYCYTQTILNCRKALKERAQIDVNLDEKHILQSLAKTIVPVKNFLSQISSSGELDYESLLANFIRLVSLPIEKHKEVVPQILRITRRGHDTMLKTSQTEKCKETAPSSFLEKLWSFLRTA